MWSIPTGQLGSFIQGIYAPLGLGKVQLYSGELVTGFICAEGMRKASQDFAEYHDWRRYLA